MASGKELKALVSIAGQVDASLNKSIAEASRSLQGLGTDISKVGKTMSGIGDKLTATVTAPIVAAGTAAVVAASDYETSFAKLSTIADTTVVSTDELKDSIMSLSNETGMSASDISEAAYSAISAGQDTADALQFVESAAKLAKGGFTDVSTSTDVLTTALNAYGLAADQVSHVSDVLIQTQNEGKTTVDELAASMGKVIPTAAAANVGIEDLSSQYVALTKNGIGTAEATTYINSMINELTKSGSAANKAFKEAAGTSFPDYIAAGHSTAEAMQLLASAEESAGLKVTDAFGSAEAGKAANVLVQHASDATTALGNMQDMSGQTQTAFETMNNTTAADMERLKTSFQNLAITIGEDLLPVITPVMEDISEGIKTVSEKWNELDPETQQMIIKAAMVAAALGPVLSIGGRLVSTFGAITSGAGTVIGKLGGLTSSLGSFGSKAATAATGASSAAASFSTMAGQALLLLAAGAAVAMIAGAMWILVQAATQLAAAGPAAVGVFILLAAVAIGVTAAIVAIGSAATVSAVGLLAMGAAVLMVGAGIALAAAGATLFCTQLPTIATYGPMAASGIIMLSGAIVMFSGSMVMMTGSLVAGSAALLAFGAGALVASAGAVAFGGSMGIAAGTSALLLAALLGIQASMTSINTSATSAASSLTSMVNSVNVVESALNGLADLASGAVNSFLSIFEAAAPKAQADGTKLGTSLATGIKVSMVTANASLMAGFAVMTATATAQLANLRRLFASTRFEFNHNIALPHFSLSGKFDAKSNSVPTVGVNWYAAGGFTDGLSIAGEDGMEAVLSFNPAYRSQNLSYWAKAGQLLGVDSTLLDLITGGTTSGSTTQISLGGVSFNPSITINGNATKEDVIAAIREEEPEFFDLLDRYIEMKEQEAYGYSF